MKYASLCIGLVAAALLGALVARADTGAGVGGGGPRDVHLFFMQEQERLQQQRRAAPADACLPGAVCRTAPRRVPPRR